ncbi:hypothetical protein F5Y06DRAFT_255449 [Hypoxylon sp. FL0890]|nr:hypothetical protein F5Y06DRAFT_255449 [Hypoxylon sp. FL0890]
MPISYSGLRELALINVRKLAISHLASDSLSLVLPCVPKLEDLAYYWDEWGIEDEFDFEDIAELLEPVRRTLRRLCIGITSSGFNISTAWIHPPVSNLPPLRALRKFNSLEELYEISISIYLQAR